MTDSSLEAFSEIKEQLFPGLGFMYDNEYFSRKAGGKVKVINAGDDLSEN